MLFPQHSEVKLVYLDDGMAILNVIEKRVEIEFTDSGYLVLGKLT